ncbi:MAG TPA: TolC family protein [Gemmatimonadaceae bacterium]|nr:TolC family protein [Gemmatimonadaceae bacterium]
MYALLGWCALVALGRAVPAQGPARLADVRGPNVLSDRAAPVAAPGDTIRLTRRAAIAEALARNPQIEIARQQTAQARARRVQGIAIPDPALVASYDEQTRLFGLGTAGSRPVSLDLAVPFPDKFRLQNRIGTADIGSFESNFVLQRQLVAFQTSAAYDSLLVAQRHRADLQEGLLLASDFLKRTQARYAAGTAAKLDVIKAQVDVAQARNDLIASERDVATAEASLNRQLGRDISAPITPADSLDVPPPLPDSSEIDRIALANRPELAILQNQQRGAAANTALAREYWLPDLTVGISRDYALPGSPLFTTGIALPLPAFFWQHTNGEIAASAHFERELAATYRDTRAQVVQDVRSAYASASTAMRQVTFIRDELVPSAREAFRVATTSYTLGGASALEVLDARRALLDAESQLADALADANTSRADLERALGVPIQSLGASNR